MTQLEFTRAGRSYHAEVTLGPDLQLDEILEVRCTMPSGAQYEVVDTAELEDAIDREVQKRSGELRARRDASRQKAFADLKFANIYVTPPRVCDIMQTVVQQSVQQERCTMTFQLKGLNKKGNQAIYTSGRHQVRFGVKGFVDGVTPETIEIDAPLTVPVVKEPKVKMTAEERKAARAAKPKPTVAEKLEAARKRVEKLQASLEL